MAEGIAMNGVKSLNTSGASSSAVDASTTEQILAPPVQSKVVQRLIQQNAKVHSPGLAQIPLPPRPSGVPPSVSKKPLAPMVAARNLNGGASPLAPTYLQEARSGFNNIGKQAQKDGKFSSLSDAHNGSAMMPSRHGLVAYTTNPAGQKVYLTKDRWNHIVDNHMEAQPQPRGKRTTTYWPTRYAVNSPSMNEQDVLDTIIKSARKGHYSNEVRDTRMAQYDLDSDSANKFGVSEAKVSMAPDGLILSAYPGAGSNVLAVYELSAEDQAELARLQQAAQTPTPAHSDDDNRMFHTNIAQTTFG